MRLESDDARITEARTLQNWSGRLSSVIGFSLSPHPFSVIMTISSLLTRPVLHS